jgi:hypothetical protein
MTIQLYGSGSSHSRDSTVAALDSVTNYDNLLGFEFWHDRLIGPDDLERTDGGDWQRVANCRRPLGFHGASLRGKNSIWLI